MDGRDIEELARQIQGRALRPDQEGYDEARRIWNAHLDQWSEVILRCRGPQDAVAGVKHARIGAGTRWSRFDEEAQASNLATTGGTASGIGVAGLTLGGGTGYGARKRGLAIDNLLAASVATSFDFRLHELGPEALAGQFNFGAGTPGLFSHPTATSWPTPGTRWTASSSCSGSHRRMSFPGSITESSPSTWSSSTQATSPKAKGWPGASERSTTRSSARWSRAEEVMGWTRDFHRAMDPYSTGGVYVNLLGRDEEDRVPAAYGDNHDRLVEIKKRWDPDNLFRMYHTIEPVD